MSTKFSEATWVQADPPEPFDKVVGLGSLGTVNASWEWGQVAYFMASALSLGSLAQKNTINDGDWSGADLSVSNGGTGASTQSGARSNLGLVIGTDVQAFNVNLAAIAGQTLSANKLIYATGAGAVAQADFTPGSWTTWTPTVSATTPAGSGFDVTVTTAKYAKIGRTVHISLQLTINSLGTGPSASGSLTVTLPFAAQNAAQGFGRENASTGNMLQGNASASSSLLTISQYNNATVVVAGYQIRLTMTYEATS